MSDVEAVTERFCGYDMEFIHDLESIAFGELSLWERYYLPIDVKDKVILDAGADCGSTAAFYLSKGARHVVSIELDPERADCIKRNAERNGWGDRIEVICGAFKVEHFESIPHDLFKCDVESGETELLNASSDYMPPCMIESHTTEITDALMQKFPTLKKVYPLSQERWAIWLLHREDSPSPRFMQHEGVEKPDDDMDYLRSFLP